MAKVVASFSERFFETRRTSMVVEAFDRDHARKTGQKTGIAQDLIELSPLANLGLAIDQFKQEGAEGSRLDLSLRITRSDPSAGSGDPQLDRDLDLMLRLIARDDKDLERLRSQFRDLFALARGNTGEAAPTVAIESGSGGAATLPSAVVDGEVDPARLSWTADMETIRELSITMEKVQSRMEIRSVQMKKADPLVLDLDDDGFELTQAGEGASFDIDADGTVDRTGWVAGDDALLALDRNGNGAIDDGRELFGEQNGAANGFLELARHDANGDRQIDHRDPVFKALKLYRDLNGDGQMQKGEFSTLSQMGIASLNLRFIRSIGDVQGNSLLLQATFQRADGSTGKIGDFQFGYRPGTGISSSGK